MLRSFFYHFGEDLEYSILFLGDSKVAGKKAKYHTCFYLRESGLRQRKHSAHWMLHIREIF
jgi:hypothetical protein